MNTDVARILRLPTAISLLPLAVALGCTPKTDPAVPAAAPTASTPVEDDKSAAVAPPTADDPATVEPDQPEPTPSAPLTSLAEFEGPLRFEPKEAGDGYLPADIRGKREATMMDHPRKFGWAADSQSYGYCQPSGGADCSTCVVTQVDGTQESWTRGRQCERHQGETIKAAWGAHRYGEASIPSTWAFGKDLTIVWKMLPGVEPEDGATPRLARLRVGAKVKGERPVYFVTVREKSFREYMWAHDIFPEVIVPSPDGQRLVIMSHSFAGEFSSTMTVRFIDVADFAFDAYHRTALKHLTKDPARAAELLATAAKIKPDAWKVHHNLACASALAGQPDRVQPSLSRAIELGGAAALAKARSDKDLDAVRDAAWFSDLVK